MPTGADLLVLGGIFLTALIVGYSGALTPGPVLTYVVAESTRRGHLVGPRVVFGHAILEGSIVVAIALGVGAWLATPVATIVIGLVGGAMLLWLGRSILAGVFSGQLVLTFEPTRPAPVGQGPVVAGVLLSAANPFLLLWWATVGLAYITAALHFGALGLVVFYAGHALSDLTWYWGVSGAIAAGRRHVHQGIYRAVLGGCGAFLIALAIYFIVEAVIRWAALG